MTAHVLSNAAAAGPGAARAVPVVALGARTMQTAVYEHNWGTDVYAANGTDISDIWDDFDDVLYIGVEQMDTSTEADRREFAVDYTAKKIVVYTAMNTEDTGNDLGVVTVRLCVEGYR